MNTYEVVFYETQRYTRVVQAESEEEAKEKCEWNDSTEMVLDNEFYEFEIASVNLVESAQ
jgi:hypothetical protein